MINLWREKSKNPNGLNEHGIPNYLAYPNSDSSHVYETGVSHQHSLSATGGSEKVTYYTSFNYLNNPVSGKLPEERFSSGANIDSQVKNSFKIGVNLSGYTANTTPVSENINDNIHMGEPVEVPAGIAHLDDQNRLGINANNEDDPQNATRNPYNRLR